MAMPPLVLLVDDSHAILDVFTEVLTDHGLRVRTAYSGEEAIEQALAQHPDLILLDLKMPGIDGYETTRRLKADPRTSKIPVLLFTGEQDDDKAHAAGCAGIIKKPCTKDVFLAAVEAQIWH